MRRQALSIMSFVSLVSVSCKPSAPASDVESLDALTGGSSAEYSCSGSNGSPFDLAGDLGVAAKRQITYPASIAADVKQAFSAVPLGLSRTLIMLGYEVRYVADPAALCGGIEGVLDQATGCARVSKVMTADAEGEKVELILSAKPSDVAHSTLLGVMSLLGNKIGKISVSEQGAFVLKDDEEPLMTQFKRDFAVAVLHDTYQRGLALRQIESLLPTKTLLTAKKTSLAQRQRLWSAYVKKSPLKAAAAELSIFANGADSYYCSTASRAAMSKWPTAERLWTATMHPDIEALAKLGTDDVTLSEDSGFGLWGRWGFGNGPARQMFSNRVAQTGYAFPRMNGLRRGWDGGGNWYSPPAWGNGRVGWRVNGGGTPFNGYGLSD